MFGRGDEASINVKGGPPGANAQGRPDDDRFEVTTRRVVIVGGVAGGMSVATRLRRLDESASIIVLERSGHVSYANCGLPYFVGGVIEDEDDLLLQTPEKLFERFRLDVRVDAEVVTIDHWPTRSRSAPPTTGGISQLPYDKLVLSTGAAPVRPPIPGFDRVRGLAHRGGRREAGERRDRGPRTAVVIGAGFVGLEMAENLAERGLAVTIVEAAPQVLTPLDSELAILVAAELVRNGVVVETGVEVAEVNERGRDPRRRPGDRWRARGRSHRRSARHPARRNGRFGHRTERRNRCRCQRSNE